MESSAPSPSPSSSASRGRGHKSRGGLGKYLRARGRRGAGRPAEFNQRLVLPGESPDADEDEEEKAERVAKYSRRQLASNADRYEESDPELDEDGNPIVEPEVDLTNFLEKQLRSSSPPLVETENDEDVDHSLDNLPGGKTKAGNSRKGNLQTIEWTSEFDDLKRDKESAEATRELTSRFRAKSERLKAPVLPQRKKAEQVVELPALPGERKKTGREEMEGFLDDLLG